MVGIILLVSTIYLYLFFKKRNYFFQERVRKHLEPLISYIIMEETTEGLEIPRNVVTILKNPFAIQFTIDEIISCKKNFSGIVALQLVELYERLGLKKYSLNKIKNKRWYVKARGIQELYLMEQKEHLKTIYHNTNSKNEFVRMEAQTGVIHLTGFPGLRFLDVISYPITEWQQLKLLEQLRQFPDKEDISEKIPNWLLSKNATVVVFVLKLVDEYQYFSLRNEVINCLVHPEQTVRSQAFKTVLRLEDERTSMVLLGYFNKEPYRNQSYILDALKPIASEKETGFLTGLLDHPNDLIKLKAAIVLATSSENGLHIIEKKAAEQAEPYLRIYKHILSVK